MFRKVWCSVVLALVANPLAYSQVKIEWKLKEGDRFYMEENATIRMKVSAEGETENLDMTVTQMSSITVTKKHRDGSVQLEQRIEWMRIRMPGAPALSLDQLKGMTFRMTLSPKMELTEFEGYDEFVRRMADGNAAQERALREEMSEEEIRKRISEPFNVFLPGRAVTSGDRWTRTRDLESGLVGDVSMALTFRGDELTYDRVERIPFTGKGTITPKQGGNGNGPFQVVGGNVKADGIEGEVRFDTAAGRLVEMRIRVPLRGTLTIQAQGQRAEARLSGEVDQTIRVLDHLPE